MPVTFSLQQVIEKNNRAIQACDKSTSRLNSIFGLPAHREELRVAELSRASLEGTHLRQLNAHLGAASIVVRPIDDQTAQELNALDNALAQKIRNDLITSATIEFITGVLDDASRVRNIITQHT